MIKNKIKLGYTILPRFDKVRAELYKIVELSGKETHIHLIDKGFGSVWRKPTKKDYDNAKDWVELQIKCIENTNVSVVFME